MALESVPTDLNLPQMIAVKKRLIYSRQAIMRRSIEAAKTTHQQFDWTIEKMLRERKKLQALARLEQLEQLEE